MSDPPEISAMEKVLVWGFTIGAIVVVIAIVLLWLWN